VVVTGGGNTHELCNLRSVGQNQSDVATVLATSVMSSSQCRTARTPRMNETPSRTTARHAPLLKSSQQSHLLRVLRHSRTRSYGVFLLIKQVENYRLPLRVKLFVDKTVAA
jgi:hypothetical protein